MKTAADLGRLALLGRIGGSNTGRFVVVEDEIKLGDYLGGLSWWLWRPILAPKATSDWSGSGGFGTSVPPQTFPFSWTASALGPPQVGKRST